MKKSLVTIGKLCISAAIISWLIVSAERDHSFAQLRQQDKDWSLLALAWALSLTAVSGTFIRWYILGRALRLPFRLKDAFRLGFLGYMLNFVSVGNVGGDLFKAVFIAREHRGRRAEAVASVIVDRLLGMYSLFLLLTIGILVGDLRHEIHSREIEWVCNTAIAATVLGTLGLVLLLSPWRAGRRSARRLRALPRVGQLFESLLDAAALYRGRYGSVLLACLISLGTHTLFTLTIFAIACGLPGEHPSLIQHFVIVPISSSAAATPLPLGALGAFEYVLDFLYKAVSDNSQGLLVALGYRLLTVVIAMVGACFYLTSRREVSAVLHEAEAHSQPTPVSGPGSMAYD